MGVVENLPINKFVSIKDNILYLAKLFSFLDGNFENPLIKKMFIDIISIIHLFDKIGDEDIMKKYYEIYKEQNLNTTFSLEEFSDATSKHLKDNRLRTVAILNTKLYYFDLLIWEHALLSKKIVKYLFSTGFKDIKNTHDYLTVYHLRNIKADQTDMMVNFTCKEDNLFIEYTTDDLEYLDTIRERTDNFEFD